MIPEETSGHNHQQNTDSERENVSAPNNEDGPEKAR